MKKIIYYVLPLILALAIISCGGKKTPEEKIVSDLEKIEKEAAKSDDLSGNAKIFNVKSGYIKYKNIALGMETSREFWFDDYGALQYEENTMEMMGIKTGSKGLVKDGYRYTWNINDTSGAKIKFLSSRYTEFEELAKEDIDRYKMKDHGTEVIAGKKCRKVSVDEPVSAMTWTWEGLPIKTVTKMGDKEVVMEAIEVKDGDVPASKFEVPSDISFTEM
jgi:hypothetical protein